jgi:flagellar motor switch protein FliN
MSEIGKGHESSAYARALEEVGHLADIPMRIAVHIGTRSLTIREVLQLKKNSIIELPKSAGENVEICVNSALVGSGEVLDLEGTAGVRLTDFATS